MILTIKTDQPTAELGLHAKELEDILTWQGHYQLSSTILTRLQELLSRQQLDYQGLTGIVVFQGPGSFTGLRIGATVANTLAYSLSIPVIGSQGDDWRETGISRISTGEDDQIVKPAYGGEANITKPRK